MFTFNIWVIKSIFYVATEGIADMSRSCHDYATPIGSTSGRDENSDNSDEFDFSYDQVSLNSVHLQTFPYWGHKPKKKVAPFFFSNFFLTPIIPI